MRKRKMNERETDTKHEICTSERDAHKSER